MMSVKGKEKKWIKKYLGGKKDEYIKISDDKIMENDGRDGKESWGGKSGNI